MTSVPPSPYPLHIANDLRTLLAQPEVARDIRRYNSALAFVSFADTGGNAARHLPGQGPFVYAIEGQVYHSISSLDPPPDKSRAFGQLYFCEPDVAIDLRLSAFEGLGREVLDRFQRILYYDVRNSACVSARPPHQWRQYNPYVSAFRHMSWFINTQ
jgi:hypothetical protein